MNFLKLSTLTLLSLIAFSQVTTAQNEWRKQNNAIMTAVPFLAIAPDSRGGAMGDAGVSSSPDANSMYWNPAKLAFIDKDMGLAISYSPWLHKLVNDINLAYLTGFKRINKNQVVGVSLRYFNLGNITFTSETGDPIGDFNPNEFAVDGGYSRLLSKSLSMAVTARYIHSNLTLGQYIGSQATKPGNSIAADIGVYQQFPVKLNTIDGRFSWGLAITNLGSKITYSDANIRKDFIPTNLRLGPTLYMDIDDYNSFAISVDINKLLVPTTDTTGFDQNVDKNVSPITGLIKSFYDAPGGLNEELAEYSFATGLEYWYDKQFALRTGFFYEDKNKGNRKFVTLGAGLRYSVINLDFSYLVPMEQTNPLANTIRFSLIFNFNSPEN